MTDLSRQNPDYEAIRSRAFGWLIDRGRLTQPQIDEALEAGAAALRYDRRHRPTQFELEVQADAR